MTAGDAAHDVTVVNGVRPVGIKRRSVILMIVLTLLTFGLYYPIWFLRRRTPLNQMDSPRKIRSWPALVAIAVVLVQVGVSLVSGNTPIEQTIGAAAALLLSLVRLAAGVMLLVQSFFIKDILEDHLSGPGDTVASFISADTVKLSNLMTFFFTIFYLQYSINRYIVAKPV